jgi:hypothetical protein
MSEYAGNQLDGSFGYSEATATWSVRYIYNNGFECILSLQAESGAEVLKKAESAIAHLTEAKCIPLHKESRNIDNRDNGKSSGSTVLVKQDGNGNNPTCPIHPDIEMQKWTKNGRTWLSHRWEDGWCNGKKS